MIFFKEITKAWVKLLVVELNATFPLSVKRVKKRSIPFFGGAKLVTDSGNLKGGPSAERRSKHSH